MNNIHPDLARVLITPEQIHQRVKEMADQISRDFNQIIQALYCRNIERRLYPAGRFDERIICSAYSRFYGTFQLWQDHRIWRSAYIDGFTRAC